MKQAAIFNWSGGKDSALALYKVRQAGRYHIQTLLTSVSEPYQRISMHGVRTALLDRQAAALGLPCHKLYLPETPTMAAYEQQMRQTLTTLQAAGATASIFGDIFLDDLRRYREARLAEIGLEGVFPLWGVPTTELIREFLGLGFKTITTCVNEKFLDRSFVGRVIDEDFLRDLPPNVDPCGENGEFHTFVFDGPLFREPIPFELGEIVYRKYTGPPPADPAADTADYDCAPAATAATPGVADAAANAAADAPADPSPFDTGFWYCDLV